MEIDLKQMEWIARASSDDEGYLVIERGEDYRIGIAARNLSDGVRFTLEFLVRVIDQKESIADALNEFGYTLREDCDGWICSEKNVDPDSVPAELRSLNDLKERYDLR